MYLVAKSKSIFARHQVVNWFLQAVCGIYSTVYVGEMQNI